MLRKAIYEQRRLTGGWASIDPVDDDVEVVTFGLE
jgi:hypothetical protein